MGHVGHTKVETMLLLRVMRITVLMMNVTKVYSYSYTAF